MEKLTHGAVNSMEFCPEYLSFTPSLHLMKPELKFNSLACQLMTMIIGQ